METSRPGPSRKHSRTGSFCISWTIPFCTHAPEAQTCLSTLLLTSVFEKNFEMLNLHMKTGDTLELKGKISDDAEGFSINLGHSSSDLALHFNPRFNEPVIVCNSLCSNKWQTEYRDHHLPFSQGSTVKLAIEMKADKFEVKLPDGHDVEFPNRHCYNKVTYMSINGGFRVTSFKLD
ncbi:galectin-2 isoform X2 [Melanerpes formicivorus]|uniref:galectin-2 isoform X2 n=1 Tax=Melanerpes formicivorus TaxID=211600 RepID=UPI00358E4E3D